MTLEHGFVRSYGLIEMPVDRIPIVKTQRLQKVFDNICASAALLALGVTLLIPNTASAQYPERKITFVVPMTAGGLTDVLARIIGDHVQRKLGKPVIVENKPGGGTMIGTTVVAREKPDGYTFLSAPDAIVINPILQKNPPYDVAKDLAPVTELMATPNVLFVRTDSNINTFAQLVELAKKEGNPLNYASPGRGTLAHLAMEIVNSQTGMNIVHIPYAGGAPQMQAVLAGTVQVGMLGLNGPIEHIKSGKLRALAIFDEKRWPDFPDVPTGRELGISLPTALWFNRMAFFTTAGVPKDIIDKMSQLAIEAVSTADNRTKWRDIGLLMTAEGPDALGNRIQRENPVLKDIIAGMKF